tara:strand:- start:287 stop:487 length:201 start_codon:yes stop_codon:yes gene_type:complete
VKQLLFDFAIKPPIRFFIKRNRGNDVEVWEYADVTGVTRRADSVIIKMKEYSAFIPMCWVVQVEGI